MTGLHNQKDVSPEVRFRGVPPGFEGLIGGVWRLHTEARPLLVVIGIARHDLCL